MRRPSRAIRGEMDAIEIEVQKLNRAARRLQVDLSESLRFERAMDPPPASVFERRFHETAKALLPESVYQHLVSQATT